MTQFLTTELGTIQGGRSLPHVELFEIEDESGTVPPAFNLLSALYHVSGTAVFTFESPHGLSTEEWENRSHDRLLDIQLTLYESMMRHALEKKDEQ